MTIQVPLGTEIKFARLRLPAKFHRTDPIITMLYLIHALFFFVCPAIVAFLIVDLPASTTVRVISALMLGIIGGHGMHLLTFVGHEGMHTNLSRNKYVSAALGILFASLVPFFPFSQHEMRWIARINLALGLCAVTGYGFIWHRSLWLGCTVMLIPYFALYVFTSLRAYIEHTGTVPGIHDSRSYTLPLYTALFFGGNFHLEHHQYPAVPSYRLPALHKYLTSLGIHQAKGVQVERSFFGALRYTTARYQYPCVNL